jgi:hypothetical protein
MAEVGVTRRILGVRDDLHLRARWWHRLFLVAFVISTVGIAIFVGDEAYEKPQLRGENVVVLGRLVQYTASHPELTNTVPSFAEVGLVGVERLSGEIDPYYGFASERFCAADLKAHAKAAAAFARKQSPGSYEDLDENGVIELLEKREAKGNTSPCIGRGPNSARIIAYQFTSTAKALAAGRAVALAGGAGIVCCLVLANAYNRGLLYIIFGARRRNRSAAAPRSPKPGRR